MAKVAEVCLSQQEKWMALTKVCDQNPNLAEVIQFLTRLSLQIQKAKDDKILKLTEENKELKDKT